MRVGQKKLCAFKEFYDQREWPGLDVEEMPSV